jgi:proteasome assembly chaperone (PAC2) family protein
MMDKLRIDTPVNLNEGRLILAFSGWMDGGEVSTGTVQRLTDALEAVPVAEIEAEGFYIYNFPADMETAALFRPHIKIEDGIVRRFELPRSRFYCSEEHRLAFFIGKEPNLNWGDFAQCIFDFVSECGIASILFVGSFAGSVPHTREPRLHVSASEPHLRDRLKKYGLRPTNYEGPGSFMTYLTTQATQRRLDMANIAAEIPSYVQGTNPSSIEAVTRRLAAILGLEVDLSKYRSASNDWESHVSKAIEDDENLLEQVRKLEKLYDDELLNAGEIGLPDNLDLFGAEEE